MQQTQTDTLPDFDSTPAGMLGDFTSDGVEDFGSAGAFEGTLPGEQAPQSGGAPASDIDSLLDGVDLTDQTEALNDGKKVDFTGNVIGVKKWTDGTRTCLIFDIVPVSPPVCAAAGKQGLFVEIKGDGAAKGAATLRALAKACGKPVDKPSQFVGCVVEGKMNKAKKTGKIYMEFAA